MRVTANGHEYDIAEDTTVAMFIRARSLDPQYVVVERNGQAVERARYDNLRLEPGDRLELVRAVAGGSGEEETILSEPAAPSSLGEWRRRRLGAARLYVVTDARQEQGDLADFLEEILDAGVDIVQVREKDAEAGELLRWAEVFREAAERHQALFFVNDRPDVALACGADGVHVGQNDLSPVFVRGLVGSDVLIGLSTHDPDQFAAAAPEADHLCAGPVHATPTKPGRPATGLDLISFAAAREAAGDELRPWFAIGGIDRRTLPDVVESGARRIVVVRAVTQSDDPTGAVEALRRGLAAAD